MKASLCSPNETSKMKTKTAGPALLANLRSRISHLEKTLRRRAAEQRTTYAAPAPVASSPWLESPTAEEMDRAMGVASAESCRVRLPAGAMSFAGHAAARRREREKAQ